MFWRKKIIRFQATTSDARLFTTWQPCIGEWNSMTPQRLPKVPPPTTWIDTSLLWFDLIAYPRILLCPVLNSTWPKLVWNCPCLHMFAWGTCMITASNTSLLQHRAKPNARPSRTLDYKALWYYARNRNPASQPDREILWMDVNGMATTMLTRFGCLWRICIQICN